jgi:hypothetical protein
MGRDGIPRDGHLHFIPNVQKNFNSVHYSQNTIISENLEQFEEMHSFPGDKLG